jgi:hypothetical protein
MNLFQEHDMVQSNDQIKTTSGGLDLLENFPVSFLPLTSRGDIHTALGNSLHGEACSKQKGKLAQADHAD